MVTFSFVFGAFVESLISIHVGATSVWFCSFLLLIEAFYMYEYELKNKDDFNIERIYEAESLNRDSLLDIFYSKDKFIYIYLR